MEKITRQVLKVSREQQMGLFEEVHGPSTKESIIRAPGVRTFVNPDPHDIFLGQCRLEDHLKQSKIKSPFIVRDVLGKQDWVTFESRYAPVGRAPYSPKCMMGLILYGIMQGVTSLRGLANFARTDLGSMWVTGGIYPDHSNIARFITLHGESFSSDFFEGLTKTVLKQTGSTADRLAGDGTVLEAACSHYNLLKGEAAQLQLQEARRQAQKHPEDTHKQADLAMALKVYDELSQRKQARDAKGKKSDHLCISATEPDAMVQPLKRGRGSGPSYKPSVLANEKRVVVALDVDASSETAQIPVLLDQSKQITGSAPKELLLDAGYFCDQMIKESLERDISLLCPEGKRDGQAKQSSKYFTKGEFRYDEANDTYRCPAGHDLSPVSHYKGNDKYPGYVLYSTPACATCPLKDRCTQSKEGRKLKRYAGDGAKDALRLVMEQAPVKKIFSKRQAMVEPVFSALRGIQGLNRFRRKGLSGVKREFALHILAYNISRVVAINLLELIALYRGFWLDLQAMNRNRWLGNIDQGKAA